jgi:serine-type D-Ala-D-Ala carboxypeptidase/endopeptidase (penicillin-binding protein 4)
MRRSRSFLLILLFLTVATPRSADTLGTKIAALTEASEYKHAHWGILVQDLASGEVIFEQNGDKLFAPASVTKLFSTAAALQAYGGSHTFETPVYAVGKIEGEILEGDLVLVPQGDLNLGGRTTNGTIQFTDSDHTYANFFAEPEITPQDPLAGLNELARQIAELGIRKVTGDVLVDDRLFIDTESTGSGPALVTPIMINDNLIDIIVTPRKEGRAARVTWRPRIRKYTVDAQVETVAADAKTKITIERAGEGRLMVRGQVPEGKKPVLKFHEIENPREFARSAFIEALGRQQVRVQASALANHPPRALPSDEELKGSRKVATLTSAPFSEEIKLILKVSHNLHASTLPLLLAVKHGKRTLVEGLQLQGEFLKTAGLEEQAVSFAGGAGGSRGDYVTPRATVELLKFMHSSPHAAAYKNALPILGVDGTLGKTIPKGHPAIGKVFAKTGTYVWSNLLRESYILNSKALAGYIEAASGKQLAFAIFMNNMPYQEKVDSTSAGKTLGEIAATIYELE